MGYVRTCDICGRTEYDVVGDITGYQMRERKRGKWEQIDVCRSCYATIRKLSKEGVKHESTSY